MAAPIPKNVLEKLKRDEFMQQCCCTGKENPQWHHNLEYGRKAINEAWCILPLSPEVHAQVRNIGLRRLLDWCMLNRATDAQLEKYSRVMNYKQRKNYLNRVFGEFSPRKMKEHYETNRHLD